MLRCTIFVILCMIAPCSTGRVCSSCRDVEGGAACNQHTTCLDNEVCYMQHFTTDAGNDLYDFGCSIKEVCGSTSGIFVGKRTESHHTLCYECCNGTDLCNQQLACSSNLPKPVSTLPAECSDISPTINISDVYIIYPSGRADKPVHVHCIVDDMARIWTVIQQRSNGSVKFYRDWNSYKNGFGDPNGEYWLGNDVIHVISSNTHHELLIRMTDFDGVYKYAEYTTFHIGDEAHEYTLFVSGYTGTAGDDLSPHVGCKFSTYDMDNDKDGSNFASVYKGAWWFSNYTGLFSHLNGEYLNGQHGQHCHGVYWYKFKGCDYSLRSSIMMIRKNTN